MWPEGSHYLKQIYVETQTVNRQSRQTILHALPLEPALAVVMAVYVVVELKLSAALTFNGIGLFRLGFGEIIVAVASGPCCEHLLIADTLKLFHPGCGSEEFITSPKGYSKLGLVTFSTSPSSRSNDRT